MGSSIIQENFAKINEENEFDVIEETKEEVLALLKKQIRPEFLNRIDEIVMFRPLNKKDILRIVDIQLAGVKKMLAENQVEIEFDEKVKEVLAEVGFDAQFGARPLKRAIQKRLLNELSKEILAGNIQKDSAIYVTTDEYDRIIFENVVKAEEV
jgi:ATP-dependent Clp protease ATP-binding subunit ClpB